MNKIIFSLFFIFFIFFFILFFGCTESEQKIISDNISKETYSVLHPCLSKPCNDLNNLNFVVKNYFDFNSSDYLVECMECAFPYESVKGSYSKARLDLNGQKMEVYYRQDYCSNSVGCSWEVCFSTELTNGVEKYFELKQKYCSLIQSVPSDLNISSCKSEVIYDSNTIKEKCFDGQFETFDGNNRTFSVIQNITKCGYSVQRGKITCLN